MRDTAPFVGETMQQTQNLSRINADMETHSLSWIELFGKRFRAEKE